MAAERRPFRCTLQGRFGAAALTQGRVLAAFERSFYIENDAGDVACLGPAGLGAGPLNVLYDMPGGLELAADGVEPGAPVRVEGEEIAVGRLRFAVDGPGWEPPAFGPGWRRDLLAGGLDALATAAEGVGRSDGFASWVAIICRGRPPGRPAVPQDGRPWCGTTGRPGGRPLQIGAQAGDGVAALQAWLRHSADDPPEQAASLIGLGPGLTPSGDDLLGGMLVALHALGDTATARRLGDWVLARAATATSRISLAHLRCAAAGEAAEPLHLLLAALGMPGTPGLDAALARLAAIGHSSGLDALAGAALVLATSSVALRH
jgi:hypothetical protein